MRTVLTSSTDPLLGRLIDGRYEISGRIAQGGMAVVYSAFDTRLDRPVAVKVMHPALAADEEFVGRFRREAKAAARLSSPHVVAVTDQGRDGDVVFLVMELIEGRTARELLREAGRLAPREALELILPVLEALAAAHRAGLIHRDVKPENVLVADDGAVKVGDFGLARAVDASPLTATAGLLLGTVAYLAPEQVARGVADARADVYACGVMLYELLTGRPPFEGPNALQVAYQHLNEDVPPPSRLASDVPPAVDRLVAAATARDPEDRPRDATALLFRTRAVLDRLPQAPGSVQRHDTRPLDLDLGIDATDTGALRVPGRGVRTPVRKPPPPFIPVPPFPGPTAGHEADVDGELDEASDVELLHGPGDDADFDDLDPLNAPALADDPAFAPSTASDGAGDRDDHDPDPVTLPWRRKKQPRAKRRFWRPSRIVILLVVLASAAAAVLGVQLAGRHATVPQIIGKSPSAAQQAVRDAHLTPRLVAEQVYSETVPKGAIAVADPGPGHQVKRGTQVTLKVSLGPERYTVPTLDKLSLADAKAALTISHLQLGTEKHSYHDTIPAGQIISFTPPAGELVKPGTPVNVVISDGPAPVKTPKLDGVTGDAAQQQLQKLGLKVTRAEEFSDTVPIGQVIRLTPDTGLHRLQTVTLTVSKGPQLVQIPGNIENYSPDHAKQLLQSLGLQVATYSFPGLDTRVLKIKPEAGSMVKVGSQVTLYLY